MTKAGREVVATPHDPMQEKVAPTQQIMRPKLIISVSLQFDKGGLLSFVCCVCAVRGLSCVALCCSGGKLAGQAQPGPVGRYLGTAAQHGMALCKIAGTMTCLLFYSLSKKVRCSRSENGPFFHKGWE